MKPLRTIIGEIEFYQLKMGYDPDNMTLEERLQALRNYSVALMMEQAEFLEEFSWKPWRSVESQKPNPDMRKVALEWVDMLFFLVDQALIMGVTTDQILKAYETKLAANMNRITSGYSKILTRENEETQ